MKRALITGISGQDGALLALRLLERGYAVFGTVRQLDGLSTWRLDQLAITTQVHLLASIGFTAVSLKELLIETSPDEIYNLAGSSFVSKAAEDPGQAILDSGAFAARLVHELVSLGSTARLFQASSSEMFGRASTSPQDETTPFQPRNVYGIGKLSAHWCVVDYRENAGGFGCSGIMYNHESALRAPQFVTRKITSSLARVFHGRQESVELGNLDGIRDWGFAGDYVEAMWSMLQLQEPEDFVLATGVARTIREFAEIAAASFGWDLVWSGQGMAEIGKDRRTGRVLVRVNPAFWRDAESIALVGDPSKAKRAFGWRHSKSFAELVDSMCAADRDGTVTPASSA